MLIEKYGSIAAMNEAIGLTRTDATLSQIRNQSVHHTTKTPRTMGDPMARKIEEALGLEQGWMDTPPTYAELQGEDDPRAKLESMIRAMEPSQLYVATKLLEALGKTSQNADDDKMVA